MIMQSLATIIELYKQATLYAKFMTILFITSFIWLPLTLYLLEKLVDRWIKRAREAR